MLVAVSSKYSGCATVLSIGVLWFLWGWFGRSHVLEALLRETDNSVRDILAETVRLVAQYDFPDEWPDLVPTIVAQLQTAEVLR